MTLVAKPRTPTMKSRFRVEIEGCGDLRLISAGPLKTVFNLTDIDEGGAATVAETVINGYKYEPLAVERPLTDDESLANWVDNLKAGIQDKRNGFVYMLDTEGRDTHRVSLEEVLVSDYEEFAGDAKAKEETMMERCTLRYRERGPREAL